MLKLFYSPGACSLAPHIALHEAGADFELARVGLATGEQRRADYLAVNPKGRVPALATDRGVLTENPAVLAHIAQSFPDAALAPLGDPFAFAEMQAFNIFLAATVHVAFAHAFRPERYADGEAAHRAMRAKAPEALAAAFALIEAKLADGRPHVHGEAYTISDPYLFVFARWLDRPGLGRLADFPHVAAHHARIAKRSAARRALAAEASAS